MREYNDSEDLYIAVRDALEDLAKGDISPEAAAARVQRVSRKTLR